MLYFLKDKGDCTGCGSCMAVCPVDCITLVFDEEGFFYPVSSDDCIKCGKCENICPINNIQKNVLDDFKQFCVAGRHLNDSIWEKSTSGGAFTAICEVYCENGNDAVFGAKFEGLRVVHDYVTFSNSINSFRKSKYVQSDMRNSYNQINALLDKNRKVIFSGTPCQVAGVKSYLGKEHDNLLCIDLVCYGVGSPGVFEKYIELLEIKHGSKVKSFTFRNKKIKMGRLLLNVVVVELENGKIIENENDLYNTAFIQKLLLRPSCGRCRYANLDRVGDLTIADFKNKQKLLPGVKGIENLSTIIVNSRKGNMVLERLKTFMEIYPVNLEDVVKSNPPLGTATKSSRNREAFFHDFKKLGPLEDVFKKYVHSLPC